MQKAEKAQPENKENKAAEVPQPSRMAAEERSTHILNTSATLLGFCFLVNASIKVMDLAYKTLIDEVAAVATLIFMASCILSFFSIRGSLRRAQRLENIADYVFLTGLLLLLVTTVFYSISAI